MRILYGVVGEGMGHALRSRVILDHLVDSGHEVLVVVSGGAAAFLRSRFDGRPGIRVEVIQGLTLRFDGDTLDKSESLAENLEKAPIALRQNFEVYQRVVASHFNPEAVISDFESWAWFFGRRHRLPVISIDNMQIINRCFHDRPRDRESRAAYRLARLAVKTKLPGAYHYLVSSFFFPRVRKRRTTLVPPIVRPEILALGASSPRKHVVVYQSTATNSDLLPSLSVLPHEFRVYGMLRDGAGIPEGLPSHVQLRPFSDTGFLEDARTSVAVIAGGGFTFMSEAVHLGVPMLSVPLAGQFEQELNASYLAKLRYGEHARQLSAEVIDAFLRRASDYRGRIRG